MIPRVYVTIGRIFITKRPVSAADAMTYATRER